MCDTLVAFNKGIDNRSFFGKNSDRDYDELQVVYTSLDPNEEFKERPYLEYLDKYVSGPFEILSSVFDKFDNNYSAIISRPIWIWGAEMGINEHGVSIGNEAVFSKEKVSGQGLLGMDILRLSLHNCKTAKQALDFMINLIQEYGQGGDGGYSSTLKYHNSFLIKDFSEAYLLETSSKHWCAKKIESFVTISNSYTIKEDFGFIDSKKVRNFKSKYENKLLTFLSKGDKRQKHSLNSLKNKSYNLPLIQNILRSHMNSSNKIKRGMNSICIHSGKFVKTETTSSLIVDYIYDKCIVWFTGSPYPCVSLYKPLVLMDNKLNLLDLDFSLKYCSELKILSQHLVKNHSYFLKHIKPLRDEVEKEFAKLIYDNIKSKSEKELIDDCKECFEVEKEYIKKVESLVF